MAAHRVQVVVPEDRRLTIELPADVPPGHVELMVLVTPREGTTEAPSPETPPERMERLRALVADLEKDPRPLHELSTEERKERFQRLRGAFRGMTSGSEAFARLKRDEAD